MLQKRSSNDTGERFQAQESKFTLLPGLHAKYRRSGSVGSMEYKNIYDFENLLKCANECAKGVRWKASVQMFEVNKLRWVAQLKRQLENETYKSKGFNEFWISERGKMRFIQSVHISERCVQKSLSNNVLKPVIIPKLIYDNSASLKGKGTEFALRRLKCHLERHYRKHGRRGGILILDFKNYFGSIDHEKLISLLEANFDESTNEMISAFINAFDGQAGIGLGSEISQICAVFFPNFLDHYIKEKLHIKGYGRYMDDSYLIHEDIQYLKHCLDEIKVICGELGISINNKRARIVRFDSGSFEYLKKRITLNEDGSVTMRLTRNNVKRRKRILRKQRENLTNGTTTLESIIQSQQSWKGYARKYNTHKVINMIDWYFYNLFREELDEWLIQTIERKCLNSSKLSVNKSTKDLMKLARRMSKNERLIKLLTSKESRKQSKTSLTA